LKAAALAILITLGITALFARTQTTIPSPEQTDPTSTVGVGGSVFLGTTIGRNAYLEARIFGISRLAGYQFSGVTIVAGARFSQYKKRTISNTLTATAKPSITAALTTPIRKRRHRCSS
jgi:hypothetical protein